MLVCGRKHEVLQNLLVDSCVNLDLKKHSGPTPADDMAPQINTDYGNFTLDFKHGALLAPRVRIWEQRFAKSPAECKKTLIGLAKLRVPTVAPEQQPRRCPNSQTKTPRSPAPPRPAPQSVRNETLARHWLGSVRSPGGDKRAFGTVPVGTSRLRLLAVENPNAEPVRVAVGRPPPASKGFRVQHRRPSPAFLQPGERIFISITWTPLEGGKIRELITFIVNDVVKHQAVLLGTADQPVKRKRSLWDTIKKKSPSQHPRSKKRLPIIKNVNKTFQMPEKLDRGRSPLQSCENLEVNRASISPDGNSLYLSESQLSLSPITPIMQENQHVTCTPVSVRSTTYCALGTAACDELRKDIKETCTVTSLSGCFVERKLESPHNIVSSIETQTTNRRADQTRDCILL
ncbi:hypothetical protein JRQ81_014567 [Phrynocephalus forsythii]|uniref:Abnormal spindle-like microcephaly-associated protein ASH domain-containing protein n=1 Tax=Phrynocephalus forsythii TaxID=171643 RepID=A0A9Q1B2Y8_9SAUR|nr:hypothetical protein JRQ81_014567 [Phrynocephalus forsythii]